MDLATSIGIIGGFALIFGAIMMGGDVSIFADLSSLLIVVGGTVATMFVRHKLGEVFGTFNVTMKAFFTKQKPPQKIIEQLTDMANIARKDGILALEKVKSDDRFMQNAINHCVDGADPDFLESVLKKELEYLGERHLRGIAIWQGIGESAPSFGMIGTLIGLVQMLANLEDPSTIGPALSLAMLASLYGIIIANLVAFPLAGKLADYSHDEQMLCQVIIDGMIGIQKGVNPRMLQEALKSSLPPHLR
ncbi:MAG: MotA/TolQ/ExbB proton channel family protein [Magnetococcus sp. DMHC-6]